MSISKSKIVFAALIGAAAGVAIGFLLTSEKGKQIRKDMTGKARDLADSILEKAEEIIDEAEEAALKAKSENNS